VWKFHKYGQKIVVIYSMVESITVSMEISYRDKPHSLHSANKEKELNE